MRHLKFYHLDLDSSFELINVTFPVDFSRWEATCHVQGKIFPGQTSSTPVLGNWIMYENWSWNRNSVNSANSWNLINHWSMNWSQFKDPVSHMCFVGTVVGSWCLYGNYNGKYFCYWIQRIQWQHLGKTQSMTQLCVTDTYKSVLDSGHVINLRLKICRPARDNELRTSKWWMWLVIRRDRSELRCLVVWHLGAKDNLRPNLYLSSYSEFTSFYWSLCNLKLGSRPNKPYNIELVMNLNAETKIL